MTNMEKISVIYRSHVCFYVAASLQAISSLNKYPLPLQNAKEAKILQNFGDGICKILDDKLQRYLSDNGEKHMTCILKTLRRTCRETKII